jgi:hypothetical protein
LSIVESKKWKARTRLRQGFGEAREYKKLSKLWEIHIQLQNLIALIVEKKMILTTMTMDFLFIPGLHIAVTLKQVLFVNFARRKIK